MTDNEISEKLISIVCSFLKEEDILEENQTFEENGIGSLVFVKIMVEIEIQFNIELDDRYYTSEYKNIKEFLDKLTKHLLGGDENAK